jgi:hypothetical protein
MKRAKHSLSHFKLLTCKMGQLVPVAWFEALPGDTIQHATSALIRCAPLVTPVMHPVQVRFHHWFVPNRLIWSEWQDFITGGESGTAVPTHPQINVGTEEPVSSLSDYLGINAKTAPFTVTVNALPFRAYQLIWNEFYRDEDLQTKAVVATGSGADTTTSLALQNVCWEKDYLTSARPWAQKGAAITLPLGTSVAVKTSSSQQVTGAQQPLTMRVTTDGSVPVTGSAIGVYGASGQVERGAASASSSAPLYPSNLFADLSTATATDINTIRQAFALQRFEEARARYGSRYTEYLRYLGVRSSDARLQRPEYLGGGKNVIQFSEVLQSGPSAGGSDVGKMFGHGITATRTNRYRRFFEEHGIVMTLMSVRPKTMYTERIKRAFFRGIAVGGAAGGMAGNKYDYWQRELQHIGQQGIANWEADVSTSPVTTFGFQDRYDEYRREESSVAGLFRTTLNTWHLSREFSSAPALNATFVSCVPSTRVFQDLTADNLYVMANHSIQARRLVAREGTSMTF